jgi:hypothetical protein
LALSYAVCIFFADASRCCNHYQPEDCMQTSHLTSQFTIHTTNNVSYRVEGYLLSCSTCLLFFVNFPHTHPQANINIIYDFCLWSHYQKLSHEISVRNTILYHLLGAISLILQIQLVTKVLFTRSGYIFCFDYPLETCISNLSGGRTHYKNLITRWRSSKTRI